MVTNSTQRELNNVLKSSLYKSTNSLTCQDIICLNLAESNE